MKQELLQESEWLKVLLHSSDLKQSDSQSNIKYSPCCLAPSYSSDRCSSYFGPLNDDDRDEFIDFLADNLILRRTSQLVNYRSYYFIS
jgi:hypothetical protein